MRYALIIALSAVSTVLVAQYIKPQHPAPSETSKADEWCLFAEYETRQAWEAVTPPDLSRVHFNGRRVEVRVRCGQVDSTEL